MHVRRGVGAYGEEEGGRACVCGGVDIGRRQGGREAVREEGDRASRVRITVTITTITTLRTIDLPFSLEPPNKRTVGGECDFHYTSVGGYAER